jgi:hypothetical protein
VLDLSTYFSVGVTEVGAAARYRLDSPGSKPQWSQTFQDPSSLLYSERQVFLWGVKPQGRGADHLQPFSAKVEYG